MSEKSLRKEIIDNMNAIGAIFSNDNIKKSSYREGDLEGQLRAFKLTLENLDECLERLKKMTMCDVCYFKRYKVCDCDLKVRECIRWSDVESKLK